MSANDHGHVNNLDENQRKLLKAFWISLTSEINADPSKIIHSPMGEELFYLFTDQNPDVLLLRWLRGRKWEVSGAVQLMMESLKWRHDWGVRKSIEKGENDLLIEECSSGKTYYLGKDKEERPVTYVHASEHIKGQFPFESTEKFLVQIMELGRDFVKGPLEEGTIVLDMGNVAFKNLDYQHIKFMINTMQNYYPECLGLALVINAPWTFNAVWSIIRPWLDPVVESKIRFLRSSKDLIEFIDPTFIPQRLEGKHPDFQFIPMTKEDQSRLEVFRQDKEGFNKVQKKYREAAQEYLNITLKWANTKTDNDQQINQDRIKATQSLNNTFKQMIPYISTETHYHRTGIIDKSIFDRTYDRICATNDETTRL